MAAEAATGAIRSRIDAMLLTATTATTDVGTGAVMAVPLARATATSEAAVDMAETNAGQETAVSNPVLGMVAATTSVIAETIAETIAALTSRSSFARISETANSTSRASTRGRNVARTRATRSLTIVSSMRAIIRIMMTPQPPAARAAAAGAATAAMKALTAAMVVWITTT
jgi:hypothetical protein